MRRRQMAALTEKQVPIEFLGKPFVQLDGGVIKRNPFLRAVVGANDGGVAAAVARAQIAALQNRDPTVLPHNEPKCWFRRMHAFFSCKVD